jgi:hypothetical protein
MTEYDRMMQSKWPKKAGEDTVAMEDVWNGNPDDDEISRQEYLRAIATGDWVVANALVESRHRRGLSVEGMILRWPRTGVPLTPEIQRQVLNDFHPPEGT